MKKLIPLFVAIIGGSAVAFYAWYTRPAPEPSHLTACDVSYCPQLSDTREWALLFGEMPSVDATEWNQLFGKTFDVQQNYSRAPIIINSAGYGASCTMPTFGSTSSSGNSITVYTTGIWSP